MRYLEKVNKKISMKKKSARPTGYYISPTRIQFLAHIYSESVQKCVVNCVFWTEK